MVAVEIKLHSPVKTQGMGEKALEPFLTHALKSIFKNYFAKTVIHTAKLIKIFEFAVSLRGFANAYRSSTDISSKLTRELKFSIKPFRHMVGDYVIIEFLHQEMAVAFYPYFGQDYQGGVAAMTVDGIDKLTSHLQSDFPVAAP